MPFDPAPVVESFRQTVPFASTLGLEYPEVEPGRAVVRMPDRPDLHNHVAGPHAGALFTVAESASGLAALSMFLDQSGRATPLAARAEIRYVAVAMGDVTAEATVQRPRDEVIAELDEGKTAWFDVEVVISDAAGNPTAEMTIAWALRPNRT